MEFDILQNLATGFNAAVSLKNLGFCLLGCLLGTLCLLYTSPSPRDS